MTLKSRDVRWIISRICLFVLPFVCIFLWVYSFFVDSTRQQSVIRLVSEQEKGTIIISNLLESTFSQYLSDLQVVYNSDECTRFRQHQDEANRIELEQLFSRIASRKEYILQIRFIDSLGKETVRVNNYHGVPVAVRAENLQDKSSRDYVSILSSAPPEFVYISDMDLNIENGEIVVPVEPVLRMGLPVFKDAERIGMLVINFDAYHILSFFTAYQSSLLKNISFGLIDRNGSWIVKNNEYVFGFKFDTTEANNLYIQEPDLLKILADSEQALSKEIGNHIYSFRVIKPITQKGVQWYPGGDRLWTVVSYFDTGQLPTLDRNFLLSHPQIEWIIAMALLLLGSTAVIIYFQRHSDLQRMKVSSLISSYVNDGILVSDKDHHITFCNTVFENMTGFSQSDLMGKKTSLFQTECENLRQEASDTASRLVWTKNKEGNYFQSKKLKTVILDHKGKKEYFVDLFMLSNWSMCDHLGSESRACDFPYISARIQLGIPFYCIMLQLSNEAEFNSVFNNKEAHVFAALLPSRIHNSVRNTDPIAIFSAKSYFFLVPDCTEDAKVAEIVTKLLSDVSKPITVLDKTFTPVFHCGVALCDDTNTTEDALVRKTCIARSVLNDQKGKGFLLYNQAIHARFLRAKMILESLPKAFEQGELELYYQPQLAIATNRIVGAEALIRWNSPELGSVSPEEFIPLMEQSKLMEKLSQLVIHDAINFLVRLETTVPSLQDSFTISINLTAEDISRNSTIETIRASLRQYTIAPSRLSIELTEQIAVKNFLNVDSNLQKLQKMGVSIAIDDFGTGFSSLSYLLDLSVDTLKIDRSFINNYPDPDTITIIKAIVLLAKEIGITVLSEGVETEEQLQFLKSINCCQYQGFLFSKAVEESAFIALYLDSEASSHTVS
ncbi:PAS domain S-box [Sphaerochaeta pleomorpha str. Grapes]|uniref:PAS domain S-box n=1 Tax=Sphaerochaeta pleomorpha (strain ATCC BAA-1885 / DSM 22778 / Grapes) TaxID=158190 RepID=G8QQT5_SPHPG|nr:EAL domain-containing protein [Sphaerochaeta pleomorpha]AEV28716.1 PAS domain S-box [Sphaerochaeta pleomorpha str. Grapes]